jgi:hypothetical protein
MDFLVKEINLEYEITLDKKRTRAPEIKKETVNQALEEALAQLQPTFPNASPRINASSPERVVQVVSPNSTTAVQPPTTPLASASVSAPSFPLHATIAAYVVRAEY